MPIAEDSAGGSPVPIPTNLTTNLTGEATGSGTLDYTTGDIDIAVTVVDNGHNHILSNITDVQVNNAISGQILVYNGTVWANATNTSGITAIVQDTTPQLGGNLDLNNRNITGTGNIAITGTIDGRDVSADGTKLDGIESGATADQTAAQIKTAYESNANTNNFADADVSKLSGIEPGATADQTAAQIKTAYESNADTNAFTNADHTKLDGIETAADVTDTTNVVASLTAGTNVTIAADGTISATGGTSGIAHVVDDTTPQLGGNLDLNSNDITGTGNLNFTGNVTLSGTVDGRDVAADGTKLDGIEASADVTDTANVTTAGALMDSEVTNLAQVKAFDSSDYATAAQGTIADAALPKAGGTMTGDILFNDNVKAKYGTSSDLEIYHDTNNSWIRETGTGNLNIGGDADVRIMGNSGTEFMARFIANGNVNLYHNNNLKLQTISTGIAVTGTATANDVHITDTTPNLKFTDTDGNHLANFTQSGSHLYIDNDSTGNIRMRVDGNTEKLTVNSSGIDVTGVTKTSGSGYNPANTGWATNAALITSGSYGGGLTMIDGSNAFSIRVDTAGAAMRIAQGATSGALNSDIAVFTNNSLDVKRDINTTGHIYLNSSNQDSPQVVWQSQGFGDQYIDNFQGNLRVVNSGAQQVTIKQGGNVGIGTSAPQVKLQTTVANASTEAIRITNDADSVRTHMFPAEIQAHNSNLTLNANDGGFATIIKTANTERMRIDSSGNVGIGTTSPTQKLEVAGKIQVTTTDPEIFLTDTTTGVDHSIDGNSGVGNLNIHVDKNNEGSDPKFVINVGASSGLFCIEENGDTGIGLNNPANRLHIFDNNSDIDMNSSANGQLHIDGNGYGFGIALNAQAANIYTNVGSRDLVFGVNETEVARVRTTGLDVTGGVTVSTNLNVGNATPAGGGTIESHVQSSSTPALITYSGSSLLRTHISFENSNGQVGKINTAGTQTFYVTSSDYRLKTDIQPMQGSIDRIKALKPCNFEWTGDGTRVDGFIAHEAQEVVPEAIVGDKDAMQDQQYVESEATGDIYTPAVDATYETIQVELTPAVDATYDEDGNELTPAVDATYEEQQQELTPAVDEVIHSSDVVEPDTLEEGQLWRQTTEKVMATRQVPDYQGIDQSKIVPLLTSALQDAIAKIEALETRLEALES